MTTSVEESKVGQTSADIDEASGKPVAEVPGRRVPRRWRTLATHWKPLVVTTFVVVCAAVAAAVYLGPHRYDRATEVAAGQALTAAEQGAVALLSYAPASIDSDLAAARSHLTGDFLTYYSGFADNILAPAAKQKDVHAAATVVRAAVIDAGPDSAHVLLFINQTTTSRDNPAAAQAASSVDVGLTKIGGDWRISSFDPV